MEAKNKGFSLLWIILKTICSSPKGPSLISFCRMGPSTPSLTSRPEVGTYVLTSEKAEFNTVPYGSFTFFLAFFISNSRNTHFFEKYIRIKIEGHKIFVLLSILSPKLDEVNASYACKSNSIL